MISLKVKNFFSKFIPLLSFILIVALASFFYFKNNQLNHRVLAAGGSNGNVNGFTWSSNFGWVSFNSSDCDVNNNGTYEGGLETPSAAPIGCPGSGAVSPYSVSLATTTGQMSGFAWSENLGWVYFGPDSADLGAGYGALASGSAPNAPKVWANFSSSTGQVTGWAKILSLGNDGWLKLSDEAAWPGKGATIDSETGTFNGFAWNGNTDLDSGLGWLSLGCKTGGPTGNDICASSNYQVAVTGLNTSPTATMSADWSEINACSVGALNALLQWNFIDPNPGDKQTAYQIFLTTNIGDSPDLTPDGSNTSTPLKTAKINSESARSFNPQNPPVGVRNIELQYDTTYYWWLKVWDANGADSGWVGSDNFKTYVHEFPKPDFTMTPAKPSVGQTVNFTDNSFVFVAGNQVTASTTNASWAWTFTGGTPSSSVEINPESVFDLTGTSSATLVITDDLYSCSTSTGFSANIILPSWREIRPK